MKNLIWLIIGGIILMAMFFGDITKKEAYSSSCVDSDGGKNTEVIGVIKGYNSLSQYIVGVDACVPGTSTSMWEFYCEGNIAKAELIEGCITSCEEELINTGVSKADITWFNSSTSQYHTYLSSKIYGYNSTTGTYNQLDPIPTWGGPGEIDISADYNGDGKAELAVFRPSVGDYAIKSYYSNGNPYISTYKLPGQYYVPADYDGDKKMDIGWWRWDTYEWIIYTSASEFTLSRFTSNPYWGTANSLPAPADYNGDGRAELAYISYTGQYHVLNYASGVNLDSPQSYSLFSHTPLQGDFDGDSKTDFGWYNPSSGVFYYTFSSENHAVTHSSQYTANIIPLISDFDGDQRSDFIEYRKYTTKEIVAWPSGASAAFQIWGIGYVGQPVVADYDGTYQTGGSCTTCSTETDIEFCTGAGKNCGSYTGLDNCGVSRTANCGTCDTGYTCTNNVCVTCIATTEVCDGINNDCDLETDEGCDDDNDDYCDKNMQTIGTPSTCSKGGNDCDDSASAINPEASEICDYKDNNCDNQIDPGCGCQPTTWTPLASTICEGIEFVQSSDCGTSRTSIGTKSCPGQCVPAFWTPSESTVCLDQSFVQSSDCGTSRTIVGTKTCPLGQYCLDGTCLTGVCVPDCTGKVCGTNGCGGSCGTCDTGYNCDVNGQCQTSACNTPADTNCDGIVSMTELLAYIAKWKAGTVNTTDLLTAIAAWKSG